LHIRITYSSATYKWLTENAGRYGWVNPEWAVQRGSGMDEPWHWEFFGFGETRP
jgi:LAS superfamily LD-carboxypeptidase LdcB